MENRFESPATVGPNNVQEYVLPDGRQLILRPAAPEDAASFLHYIEQVAGESDFLTFAPGEFRVTEASQRQTFAVAQGCANELFLMAELNGRIGRQPVLPGIGPPEDLP